MVNDSNNLTAAMLVSIIQSATHKLAQMYGAGLSGEDPDDICDWAYDHANRNVKSMHESLLQDITKSHIEGINSSL